jgi:hypothetical protein
MSLAYVFTIGPGALSKKGIFLLRSIEKNTSATKGEIFVYFVEDEKKKIDNEIISEVEEKATILEGGMPNKEYPLSAAHAALVEASKATDKEHLLLLDTDTIVLDDIKIHEKHDKDLYLAPEGLKRTYWASKESETKLKAIFDKFGFEYPKEDLESNYRGIKINPIFNSGVILTKNNDFPKRYLELSKKIHGELPKYNYFSDMVSVSMLASEYEVYELGPEYNFFQAYRPYPQEGTKIVHYIDLRALYRGIILSEKLGSGWFSRKVEGLGIKEEYRSKPRIKRGVAQLFEIYYAYNSIIKERDPLNFKVRMFFIRLLEMTKTKEIARKIANTILQEERFSEDKYD